MKQSLFYLLVSLLFLTGCTMKTDFTVPVWHCIEIPFTVEKSYNNPLTGTELCEMDVVFTHSDGSEINRPAFWDGANSFKVRFAPTKPGIWQYLTACKQDRSLDGIKGVIQADVYNGRLDVYKHGFLAISDSKRYFIHDDGKPFFYLGDTHWSLPFEAFESSNISGIESQFKHIVDTRIEQGFTVFQSEPIQWENHTGQDEVYDLTTFNSEVLGGFVNLDRKFKYLADKGMVHANAQLFFANELGIKREKYPDSYIEKLTRYWVARYGAYPVMWTCAQEVDNDFYFDRANDQRNFDAENNPWKIVAKSLYKYDAYRHPLTAHMEYASGEALHDGHGTIAGNSSFKNIEGHNWYACQWSPSKKSQLDFRVPKDFWNSQPLKPTVNYEGQYDHFWTNTLGARMQGWTAFLNGMFGYGYGAAGIWLITNSYPDDLAGLYDLDRDTDAEITKEIKRMPWSRALLLPAAEQVGKHLRHFFESLDWWNLTPRFDDTEWSDLTGAYYSLATMENKVFVCYFYNPDTVTGKLKNMRPEKSYTAQWYDPRNGEYRRIGEITPDTNGVWEIPAKPSDEDWVLLIN